MENNLKQSLPATDEIASILGLNADPTQPKPVVLSPSPGNLPIVDAEGDIVVSDEQLGSSETFTLGNNAEAEVEAHGIYPDKFNPQPKAPVAEGYDLIGKLLVAIPYVLIFILAVMFYYLYLTDFSFSSILKKNDTNAAEVANKTEAYDSFKASHTEQFKAWMRQFYFDVSDDSILDPDQLAPNGLTNFQNYILGLNPKVASALGNGKTDSQNIVDGLDPRTGLPLTTEQKDIIDTYFNLEVLKNQQTIKTIEDKEAEEKKNAATSQAAPEPVVKSVVQTRGPLVAAAAPGVYQGGLGVNTDIPGRLEIPSLKINVPIIWTQDPKNFDRDLQSGVVHYPGTAMPGDIGTAYISGHSSNFAWRKGSFNRVFEKFGSLPEYATFIVTVVNDKGQDVRLHYIVQKKEVYKANDQAQFENGADSRVALSTCWPIGTTDKRLVAFGKLVQTEVMNK